MLETGGVKPNVKVPDVPYWKKAQAMKIKKKSNQLFIFSFGNDN